jgi:hypothetical protein
MINFKLKNIAPCKILILNLLILLVVIFSCEKQPWFYKCSDCLDKEPLQTSLNVKIDPFTETNYPVEISLYDGNLEDGILAGTFTSDTSPVTITVYLNKKYTLTAKYRYDGKWYTAVDCVTPRVKFETDFCSKPCFITYDKEVNLQIKYR